MQSRRLADLIVDLADEKQAQNILILNIAKRSSLADFFIIMEGESDRQLEAVADHILKQLSKKEVKPLHKDYKTATSWVVLDFGSVIVHLFRPETRTTYKLEELWSTRKEEGKDQDTPAGN